MRGSDSTTAMSSRRPPMTAGPIERKRRFLSAVSYDDCAKAPAANPESATAAVKVMIGDSFLEGMTVSLNRSYCTSRRKRNCGGGPAATRSTNMHGDRKCRIQAEGRNTGGKAVLLRMTARRDRVVESQQFSTFFR